MAEQNPNEAKSIPKDVQRVLYNLNEEDKEFLRKVISEKGELNAEALENVSGGVDYKKYGTKLSKAGTTAFNWLKNNYGKVAMSAGVVLPFVAGGIAGFFIARTYMKKYLKKNPPINEQMIKTMMSGMGRTPTQKQVNQMMKQMNKFM